MSSSFLPTPFMQVSLHTLCFLQTVPSATYVPWDRSIELIKRDYTEGTVFMKPAVAI